MKIQYGLLILFMLSPWFSAMAQSDLNKQISFEGTLTLSDGTPYNLENQNLFFYLSSIDSGGNKCILYAESSSTAGNASGEILHRYGSGSAVTVGGINYNHVLNNSVFSGAASGLKGDGSGSPCSVADGSTRYVDVYSSVLNITTTITLGAVPYAHFAGSAGNAQSLNGQTNADFMSVFGPSGGSTGQVLSRSGTNGLAWINLPNASAITSIDLGSASATGILADARLADVVVAGTYGKVMVDTKGRVTSGAALVLGDITSALGYTPLNKTGGTITGNLAVSGVVKVGSGTSCTTADAGSLRYNSSAVEFCNGSAWQVIGSNLSADKEPIIASGTTAQYWRGDKTWQHLNTAAVSESVGNLYFTKNRVLETQIGTYTGLDSPISSSDTVLSAFGKLQVQMDNRFVTSGTNLYYQRGNVAIGSNSFFGHKLFVRNEMNSNAVAAFEQANSSNSSEPAAVLTLTRRLASTVPSNGFGSAVLFNADNSNHEIKTQAMIVSKWSSSFAGSEQGQLEFATASISGTIQNQMVITGEGQVGIGTATPSSRLTVNGAIESKSDGFKFPDGSVQPTAVGGYERVQGNCIMNCSVSCSAGKKVIGGGCSLSNTSDRIVESYPDTDTSWTCKAGGSSTITLYAICMQVP